MDGRICVTPKAFLLLYEANSAPETVMKFRMALCRIAVKIALELKRKPNLSILRCCDKNRSENKSKILLCHGIMYVEAVGTVRGAN